MFIFEIDSVHRVAVRDGRESPELTKKEYQILSLFRERFPQGCSDQDISTFVWDRVFETDQVLNVYISNLKRKLETIGLTVIFKPEEEQFFIREF